jgi:Protein of unknown function (DUF2934)
MKTKNSPEASRLEHASSSPLASSGPSASIPKIVPPFDEIDTTKKSENRDLEIRELAYKLYEERGRIDGQALQDWLKAEAIVRQGGKVAA